MRRRRSSILIALVATAAISLFLAACGGSSSPSASTSGGHPSQSQIQQMQQDAVRFSSCMRSHGVANFPDAPTAGNPSSGHAFKNAISSNAPAVQSAETACRHLMPKGGQPIQNQQDVHSRAQVDAMLAFARCIRGHGFPSFPDPTSTGDVTHQMIAGAGIDLHQPAVLHAAATCVGVTHGLLTRAEVARFIAGH